jgi:hypothetical protein
MNFDFSNLITLVLVLIAFVSLVITIFQDRFNTKGDSKLPPIACVTSLVLSLVVCLVHQHKIDSRTRPVKPISLSSRAELRDGIYQLDQVYKISGYYYALIEVITHVETDPRNLTIDFVRNPHSKPLLVEIEGRYIDDYPAGPQVSNNACSGFVQISTEGRRKITKWYPFVIKHSPTNDSQ